MSEKKTAIIDKHCLQNVLILAVWDDVNPVFDHSPEAIFQIYLHYKTVWWKMHLLCPDYRLLQANEQTFVLSTSPVWTTFSWLWSDLNFTACYFSCQKVTLTRITCEMWDRLCTGHPAGRGVWHHHLTTTSWLYRSSWGQNTLQHVLNFGTLSDVHPLWGWSHYNMQLLSLDMVCKL